MFAFNKGLAMWACKGPLEGRLHFSNRLGNCGGLHTGLGLPSRALQVVWSFLGLLSSPGDPWGACAS